MIYKLHFFISLLHNLIQEENAEIIPKPQQVDPIFPVCSDLKFKGLLGEKDLLLKFE